MRFVLSKSPSTRRRPALSATARHGRFDPGGETPETHTDPRLRNEGCRCAEMSGSKRFVKPLLFAAALSLPFAPTAHGSPPRIDPPRLPAAGRQTATLAITEPGRYAITAASGTGTALQLVDRLAGPGEIAGSAGERDGRLDLLLDRGTYRLVTLGADLAAGEVGLSVRPFIEVSTPQPPLLVEGKPLSSSLQDFEQRSWWLQIDTARRVVLEAAGRNLADLRLFRDGGWLVDASPARETIEPESGRRCAPAASSAGWSLGSTC